MLKETEETIGFVAIIYIFFLSWLAFQLGWRPPSAWLSLCAGQLDATQTFHER